MPRNAACVPARIESWPRLGPTERSSMMVSGAGSAPARSSTASWLALSTEKFPSMMPRPPRMALRMTGAVMTLLSSTTAKRLPTFSRVMSPNFSAPSVLNWNSTTGSPS